MPDRDKVIKGLECCGTNRSCIGCPYVGELFDGCYGTCISYLNRDALELLKEQEVRELTIRLLNSVRQ